MDRGMTRFTKAHACGNDFLIVEGECDRELAIRLCARNTGVGADGVEFLEWTGERECRWLDRRNLRQRHAMCCGVDGTSEARAGGREHCPRNRCRPTGVPAGAY